MGFRCRSGRRTGSAGRGDGRSRLGPGSGANRKRAVSGQPAHCGSERLGRVDDLATDHSESYRAIYQRVHFWVVRPSAFEHR